MKLTEAKVRKLIEWLVKLATAAMSIPATVKVAQEYSGSIFAIVPGVVLVEGAFLLVWIDLERKNQEDSDKVVNALSLLVLYGALLGIAFAYGHGLLGWLFFLSAGVLIGRSTWKTFAHSFRKQSEAKAKGEKLPRKVRKAKQKAEATKAISLINSEQSTYLLALQAKQEAEAKAIAEGRELFEKQAKSDLLSLLPDQSKARPLALEAKQKQSKAKVVKQSKGTPKALPFESKASSFPVALPEGITADMVLDQGKGYVTFQNGAGPKLVCLHPNCGHTVPASDNAARQMAGHMRAHAGEPTPVFPQN